MAQNRRFYLDYNVRGAERKRLVDAVANFTGSAPKYLKAPTFAYLVDYFTISKDGVVSFDDRADSEKIEGLISALVEQGFVSVLSNLNIPDDEFAENDSCQFILELPVDSVSIGNLTKILDAKGILIKKALGISDLPFEVRKDIVAFDWFFDLPEGDELKARIHLITALCEMSKRQKRITASEKEVGSEKYAFRCFLLRLGFIGAKYKTERKILLKNLDGDPSHR